ncbi:MAG: class I SAM-dependent methyltransferase [Chlorobia bacterium]|nr:class I SAM-dependent methyltransferase [Fimbriimonadaceae bacterium]
MTKYDKEFYDVSSVSSKKAAEIILPIVLELIKCERAIDIGCGNGPWSSVLLDLEVGHVIGVDGDYVDQKWLMIPSASFVAQDLTAPIKIEERFDLAMCIEVAEHLPESRAEGLVDDLTRLAPVVLFSAAIPGQGGTGHINEQPQTYWTEKFAKRGYIALDVIRRRTWDDSRVPGIYPQNMFLMASREAIDPNPSLQVAEATNCPSMASAIHPYTYETAWRPWLPGIVPIRQLLKLVPKTAFGAITRRLRRK